MKQAVIKTDSTLFFFFELIGKTSRASAGLLWAQKDPREGEREDRERQVELKRGAQGKEGKREERTLEERGGHVISTQEIIIV